MSDTQHYDDDFVEIHSPKDKLMDYYKEPTKKEIK
jgi:hypothetical protein